MTIDDRRRLADLTIRDLADATGLSYNRLWRHFRSRQLSAAELALVEKAIGDAERQRQLIPA